MPERTSTARNVLNQPLTSCCTDPMTGFYRNGRCDTGPQDRGLHLVCAIMTDAFLTFSKDRGNDLTTPRPEFNFPGLKAGNCWCLCVQRWKEALAAGKAPLVKLESTHVSALEFVSLTDLEAHRAT